MQPRQLDAHVGCAAPASRLESGSSNRKTFGSRTMARPMATRWRWPPDERGPACGPEPAFELQHRGRLARRGSSTSALGSCVDAERKRDVVEHAHMRIERIGLEHHGDAALHRRQVVDRLAGDDDLARCVTSSSPAIIRSSVDLPQPDGPTKTTNSPSLDLEIDALDDVDAGEERLLQAGQREFAQGVSPVVVGHADGRMAASVIPGLDPGDPGFCRRS